MYPSHTEFVRMYCMYLYVSVTGVNVCNPTIIAIYIFVAIIDCCALYGFLYAACVHCVCMWVGSYTIL